MTMSEAFDRLEAQCERIGVLDEFGEAIPPEWVFALVAKRFPEDDELLVSRLRSGEMTPIQFEKSYSALIFQFRVEHKRELAIARIRELGKLA